MIRRIGLIIGIFSISMLPAFAQDVSVNVNSFTIPELPSLPTIDGDLSDPIWDNVDPIPMDQDGDSPAAEPGTGDLDIVLKVAWDEETNALYFAINVIDEAFVNTRGLGSTLGADGYNGERLELIIDGTNSGDPGSSTTSGFHQQYTFDMPNNWDMNDPDNGEYGGFDQDPENYPISTDFMSVPVYERIEGTLNLNEAHYPFNIFDDYVESAVRIRATDDAAAEWFEAPVEYTWEVKLVPFEYLMPAADLGFDIDDPANIENGFQAFWEDDIAHDVLDMEENIVIGFCPQQNDADIYSDAPAREHQTNTTGHDGCWNSSEFLTGLILGPTLSGASVSDWALQ